MKYIFLLLITLLISLIASSQSVTDTSKVVLSYPIAKMVALDLVSCDSLRAQYEVSQNVLGLVEKESSMKDSLISSLSRKNELFEQQIVLFKEQETQYKSYVESVKKDMLRQKMRNKMNNVVSAISIGIGIFLFYAISHK